MEPIVLTIDGAEAHILEAALVIYRDRLAETRRLGGEAMGAAHVMDPIAERVQRRLLDVMYGPNRVPDDLPLDELTEGEKLAMGDHFVYPAGVGQ